MKLLSFYNRYKNYKTINFLLSIASTIFFIGYKFRLLLYKFKILKTTKLNVYVISVGNITSGGTGKTPFTIQLAKYFDTKGEKVAILCRAYNVKDINKVILVKDGEEILSDYEIAGDEPILIAKKTPNCFVLVGKDRVKLGKAALKLGATVLILDDGYQYLKLARDKNIVVIDCTNPFDNYELLPKGKLRELPDSLNRADAFLLSNYNITSMKESDLKTIDPYSKNKPIGIMHYRIIEFRSLNTKQFKKPSEMHNLDCICASGIGNPNSFESLLRQSSLNIKSHLIFSDHHTYEYADIQKITQEAQNYKVENIIVTEKDSIKIEDLCQAEPITFWSANIDISWNTLDYLDLLFKEETKQQH